MLYFQPTSTFPQRITAIDKILAYLATSSPFWPSSLNPVKNPLWEERVN
ncbi:hypothetical protein VL20_3546 [Microcystis panniformis FACHB-1757]|uniref:Uncharacterized protein n=1 Tax=Microcystis panniformis FACHB-1757 TaxID=1638788 RepID=A0A0K1S326_9CHRO|nr:hypothetical protein VL20_3546 [Microcystis panniformis FACHB-1757]